MINQIKGGATIVVDDARMVPNPGSNNQKSVDLKTGSDDLKNVPHNMDSTVTSSVTNKKLICPQCGKPTLYVEFQDQYEAWTKCSSCKFFIGMGKDDWYRMENSPNIDEKLRKMAIKMGLKVLP